MDKSKKTSNSNVSSHLISFLILFPISSSLYRKRVAPHVTMTTFRKQNFAKLRNIFWHSFPPHMTCSDDFRVLCASDHNL